MITPQMVEMSAFEASEQIQQRLRQADRALCSNDIDRAIDGLTGALGLALQLGPAATERVLTEAIAAAREMAWKRDAYALAALGPAVAGLANQVRESGALPNIKVMDAWVEVTSGLGALFGEIGLGMTLAPSRRSGLIANAAIRARSLDDATGNTFVLANWLDKVADDLLEDEASINHRP
jgi:hypothetical protein